MAENSLASIDTMEVDGKDGPLIAIMIALNVNDLGRAPAFVREVAETFKAHRMCSPPETSALLVTIIGDFSAESFAEQWRTLAAGDVILTQFMEQMQLADAMQGKADGQVLSSASLLVKTAPATSDTPAKKPWWKLW